MSSTFSFFEFDFFFYVGQDLGISSLVLFSGSILWKRCRDVVNFHDYKNYGSNVFLLFSKWNRLGLGAPIPTSTSSGNASLVSRIGEEKLRKQLFGKAWKDVGKGGGVERGEVGRGGGTGSAGHTAPKPRPNSSLQGRNRGGEDDGEEEEGRSSLGKSKKRRAVGEHLNVKPQEIGNADVESDESEDRSQHVKSHEPSSGRGSIGGGSYLDQVLSERAAKKTRKRNRNKKRKKNESADAS